MKHTKQERKEKLFLQLTSELYSLPYVRGGCSQTKKLRNKLYQDFYDWFAYCGTAPQWYRRMLNRKRKFSHKHTIYLIKNDYLDWDNATFDDNYRDSSWYW
jgi:hypothetical protein